MKNKIIFLALISFATLQGCSNETKTEFSIYDNVKLELNGQQKWHVNEDMMPHLRTSFKLIEGYDSKKTSHTTLAEDLAIEKDLFVGKCSMEGKAHDMLHTWLVPYMELIEVLKMQSDEKEAARIYADLIQAKMLFETYFE